MEEHIDPEIYRKLIGLGNLLIRTVTSVLIVYICKTEGLVAVTFLGLIHMITNKKEA